jgi:uncharacterized protein DUF4349
MSESSPRRSLPKRILLVVGGLFAFILLFVVACRIAVNEIFMGIASSKATGLSAVAWDADSMWSTGPMDVPMLQKSAAAPWIARSADLRARSSAFDHSFAVLHQIVSTHHGYLEDLRSESRSGHGRALAVTIAVPSNDFDATLADLKALGRVEAISEAGEDFAVKLATAARSLATAQINLSRLQKLQRERKCELRDAVALEKDIAQANETVVEAERQNQSLTSTVAQAHIRLTMLEDYRAPLQANLAGFCLQLRNSFVEGVRSIFSSVSLFLGVLFEFGLPMIFWLVLLFWPARLVWRRFRPVRAAAPVAP